MSIRRGAGVVVGILFAAAAMLSGSPEATAKISAQLVPQLLRTSGDPFGMAIDGQSGRAYVTDSTENTLFVFDLTSGKALAYVPTGRQPNHVVLLGARAFVSNFTDASITVVDTTTNRVLKTLAVGGLGLALNRETKRLYAAGGSHLFVLDATSDALVATIAAPLGANLWGVAVDPISNRVYATDIAHARVLVYDGATNALVGEIAIDAPGRFAIAVGAAGRVFVASYTADGAQLSVIDAAIGNVIARSPVGAFTTSLLTDANGVVYASSPADRTVMAIDSGTRRTLSMVTLAEAPAGLAINPLSGGLVVATRGGAVPPTRPSVGPVRVTQP